MTFELTEFDTLLDEFKTLPRASLFIDGLYFEVRVYPADYQHGMKDVVVICSEQDWRAKAFCEGWLDEQEREVLHHNQTCQCGEVLTVDRNFILRRVPENWIIYG